MPFFVFLCFFPCAARGRAHSLGVLGWAWVWVLDGEGRGGEGRRGEGRGEEGEQEGKQLREQEGSEIPKRIDGGGTIEEIKSPANLRDQMDWVWRHAVRL